MRRMLRLTLPLLAALVAAGPLAAQVIRGTVRDAAGNQPVPEAQVQALDARDRVVARARSGADGWFEIEIEEPGEYRLRAQRVGYQPTTSGPIAVEWAEVVDVDLRVSNAPLAVEAITVNARRAPPRVPALDRNGFYDRQRVGLGRFVSRTDIERAMPRELSDVLRRLPGIRVIPGRFGKNYVAMTRGGGACAPKVFLDGAPMQGTGPIDDLIEPLHVEAVEVYRGASEIPAQFGGATSACGVIVIWTRTGGSNN